MKQTEDERAAFERGCVVQILEPVEIKALRKKASDLSTEHSLLQGHEGSMHCTCDLAVRCREASDAWNQAYSARRLWLKSHPKGRISVEASRLATVREIAEWLETEQSDSYSGYYGGLANDAARAALDGAARRLREKYGLDEQGGAK